MCSLTYDLQKFLDFRQDPKKVLRNTPLPQRDTLRIFFKLTVTKFLPFIDSKIVKLSD